ncbi:MAG: DUF4157 domain-containing protein, partial [Anaerolineales bacterium]
MKTFVSKEKRSTPAVSKTRPYVYRLMGPLQLAQQAEIRRILRSTGAQAKLTVGQPNDVYEQEADRFAERVMTMPEPRLQRQSDGEDEEELQTKSKTCETPTVTPSLESRINTLKSGGQLLSRSERNFFEPRFGTDFSNVRLHNDTNAASVAQSINARAFTLGSDVVFGPREYSPGSASGRRLLAHELAHVMQQQRGGSSLQRVADKSNPPTNMGCDRIDSGPGSLEGTHVDFGRSGQTLSAANAELIAAEFASWDARGRTDRITVDGFASSEGRSGTNWRL